MSMIPRGMKNGRAGSVQRERWESEWPSGKAVHLERLDGEVWVSPVSGML